MDIKKYWDLCMIASLTVVLIAGVVSCKDDDDALTPEQRQQQELADEKDSAWTVLSQLIDPTTADQEDWTAGTYEATIGEADEQNPLHRVVMTNTLANAAQRFANIVGLEKLDSTTESYTYSNPQLGTLTYRRSHDGRSLATVSVDVKQVPGLQQIVYCNPAASGENSWLSNFDGRAYYRFGDVVRVTNSEMKYEYWLCVRPSLGQHGKSDSHWVTLSPVTLKNIKQKTVSGKTFSVPTSLGTDKENMENLGELLTTMFDLEEGWRAYYRMPDNNGDDAFHDLNQTDYKDYHPSDFWEIVREAWTKLGIVRDLLGPGYNSNDDLVRLLKGDGLKLLYNGYSWSLFGDKCTLYQATLKGPGAGQPLSNLCAPEYTTVTKDMRQCAEFDARRLEQTDWQNFFPDGKQRWCIRHATGKELGGGSYDKKKSLSYYNPDVDDIYVYYRYAAERGNELFDLSRKPEHTTQADVSVPKGIHSGVRGYFMFGDVVQDPDGKHWICVQGSSPNENRNYSYFISFDKCVKKNGSTDFSQLPTLEVAKQICFMLEDYHYSYYPFPLNNYPSYVAMEMMYTVTGFHYGKYNVGREFIKKIENPENAKRNEEIYTHHYWNMLYRDPRDGKAYILRLVETIDSSVKIFAYGQNTMQFFTCYNKDILTHPRRMSVDDLSNAQVVSQYANENFVSWPWKYYDFDQSHQADVAAYNQRLENQFDKDFQDVNQQNNYGKTDQGGHYVVESNGPRTAAIAKDNTQWQMHARDDLRNGSTRGTNMYKEPVIMVAVKRCVDNGTKPYYFADADNTPLYTVVVNTWEGNKYYYNSNNVEQSLHRYQDRDMRHEFWIDSVQVDHPFNIETPIQ